MTVGTGLPAAVTLCILTEVYKGKVTHMQKDGGETKIILLFDACMLCMPLCVCVCRPKERLGYHPLTQGQPLSGLEIIN